MVYILFIFYFAILLNVSGKIHYFNKQRGFHDADYSYFPESQRLQMREEARKMFYFGYENYMQHAFPKDELDPIHCTGRGPDYNNPENININDVLGDYALTLVDALDTLAIMGNSSEFKRAVKLVVEKVSFNKPNTIQVFEATIRVLGGLLSAHLIIKDPTQPFGDMALWDYDDELLLLAHDLAARLLPAFEKTATGIPHPRVNLETGVPEGCVNETCTAGAGTLLIEFGILSHLLRDPVYESVARRALNMLWKYRSNVTGLFGNVINIQTGEWVGKMSGVGAGLDSFYEYLFKAFIMFGDETDLEKFNEAYDTIKYYIRRGRRSCNHGTGFTPIYVNVNMKDGEMANNWIDALQAAWPGLQVLAGDIEEAICTHALYYTIWRRFGALPERYNWQMKAPDVFFYPLRPELVESTYLLYQATRNPFYLHVGRDILESLNTHTKVKCGYATIHDVTKKEQLEDRMESFFLSETCKYLYLLFDKDHYINRNLEQYLFTTEGHLMPVSKQFRKKSWKVGSIIHKEESLEDRSIYVMNRRPLNHTSCLKVEPDRSYFLPIHSRYLSQMESMVGLV